ncbi:MAG: hypothetical protein HY553_17345 [Elusimicrobia bacterium]|nr:hypothetical protein [Elusimicrobiota bacterium]
MTLSPVLLLPALLAAAAPPGAKVARVEGAAVVRRAGGVAEQARAGQKLGPGDRLSTAAGGAAALEFSDGIEIALGSDSILELAGPEPVRGLRLVLRDGTQELLDPATRILLAWPKDGDPSAADGRPDFRVFLPGAETPPAQVSLERARDAVADRPESAEPRLPVGESPPAPLGPPGRSADSL